MTPDPDSHCITQSRCAEHKRNKEAAEQNNRGSEARPLLVCRSAIWLQKAQGSPPVDIDLRRDLHHQARF